ncbi:MAG: hypothetical protein V1797_05675 [Pseudomonadota bacterium]
MVLLLIGLAAPAGAAVSGGQLPAAPAGPPRPEAAVIMAVPVALEPRQVDAVVVIERQVQKAQTKAPLNEATITAMAKEMGLFNVPAPNRHLGMVGGDVGYWAQQVRQGNIDRDRLLAEFAARKVVLQAAAAKKIYIPSQGDLAAAAQPLVGYFLNQLP